MFVASGSNEHEAIVRTMGLVPGTAKYPVPGTYTVGLGIHIKIVDISAGYGYDMPYLLRISYQVPIFLKVYIKWQLTSYTIYPNIYWIWVDMDTSCNISGCFWIYLDISCDISGYIVVYRDIIHSK